MCVCVCVCVCVCIYIYICMYVCMYKHIRACTQHVCIYIKFFKNHTNIHARYVHTHVISYFFYFVNKSNGLQQPKLSLSQASEAAVFLTVAAECAHLHILHID